MGDAPLNQDLAINFLDPRPEADWFEAYQKLQEVAPVYFMPSLQMYVVTRYEDLKWILNQPKLFTVGKAATGAALFSSSEAHRIYAEQGWKRYQPLSENEPVHRAYRRQIDPFMSPAAVAKREPMIREITNTLIDRFIDRGEVEFVKEFAALLPMMVIARIMGFPELDVPQLQTWSFAWALPYQRGLSEEQEIYCATQHTQMQRYIHDTMEARRKSPKDDLISQVVHATFTDPVEGRVRPLTDEELIGIFDNILVGGNETTAFSIASGMFQLLEHPDLYRKLQQDRSKIPQFVEEVLRVESPVHGLQRVAEEDVELHGVRIPKGSTIHVRYGAANRDPKAFACPHLVDLDRQNANRHMAFSLGEHFCAGAALSRLEMKVAWDILLQRLANLRAAPGKNNYARIPGAIFHALAELHVQFDKSS